MLRGQQVEIQTVRQQKHLKLMKMIREYKLTQEEARGIEQSKQQTLLEISMRFARCDVNRSYTFPHQGSDSISDEDQGGADILEKRTIIFDLFTQRRAPRRRSLQTSKLKTQQATANHPRSTSLKKIEAKTEVILNRIRGETGRKQLQRRTLQKTRNATERSPDRQRDQLPFLQRMMMDHKRQNSDKTAPYAPISDHRRLVTEEIRNPYERASGKIRTEHSLSKYGSSKLLSVQNAGKISKTQMLLLGVKTKLEGKKTLVNRPHY